MILIDPTIASVARRVHRKTGRRVSEMYLLVSALANAGMDPEHAEPIVTALFELTAGMDITVHRALEMLVSARVEN